MSIPRRSLTCAETARIVRRALRAQFTGTKFSVRSDTYAGGASIRVKWTDGPTVPAVREVTQRYCGADFDAMQDMKTYRDDTLLANEDGSYESVSYGADFILQERGVGPARSALIRREIERFTRASFDPTDRYRAWVSRDGQIVLASAGDLECGSNLLHQIAYARPWHGERCPGSRDGHAYCEGCGRYEGTHRAPHLR